MEVGGSARYFVSAHTDAELVEALRWARQRSLPVRLLGGGSNVVISDAGVEGLVIAVRTRGIVAEPTSGAEVRVTAAAGEPWDELVALTVERNLQGLECLSGIPGLVGATPIQNVGAYGQEVGETIASVRVLDRDSLEVSVLEAAECEFAYRDSRFKSREPERYVVLSVTYRLLPGGLPAIRYAELQRHFSEQRSARPSLREVRESVLTLRRRKSMLLDQDDPNRRSCGSFFVNPIVSAELALEVQRRTLGMSMPSWPMPDGRVKLAAGWLIEKAGIAKGTRHGNVGLSTCHALAIVCHEGATASEVLGFARSIQERVHEAFGVKLVPEPNVWA